MVSAVSTGVRETQPQPQRRRRRERTITTSAASKGLSTSSSSSDDEDDDDVGSLPNNRGMATPRRLAASTEAIEISPTMAATAVAAVVGDGNEKQNQRLRQQDEADEEADEEAEAEADETAADNADNDADDALIACRCDDPRLLLDLFQAFSRRGCGPTTGGAAAVTGASSSGGTYNSGTGGGSRRGSGGNGGNGSRSRNNNLPMTVFCTARGLTVHSQVSSHNRQFEASMELPRSLFSHYRLMGGAGAGAAAGHDDGHNDGKGDNDDDDISYDFTIHWHTFLQCLTVLMTSTGALANSGNSGHGNSSHGPFQHRQPPPGTPLSSSSSSYLTMSYHTSTELLRLEVASDLSTSGVVATAAIPGLCTPEMMTTSNGSAAGELGAAFGSSPIRARLLCPSSLLLQQDAMAELDLVPGAVTVRVSFDGGNDGDSRRRGRGHRRRPPSLRLSARGHSSRVRVEIPGPVELTGHDDGGGDDDDDDDARISHSYSHSHSYSLASWRQALGPLDLARETCLSVNARGILAVQHQLALGGMGRTASGRATSDPSDNGSGGNGDSAFCDFLLLPLEEDDENSDDDDDDDDDAEDEEEASVRKPYNSRRHTDDDHDEGGSRKLTPGMDTQSQQESVQRVSRPQDVPRRRQMTQSSYDGGESDVGKRRHAGPTSFRPSQAASHRRRDSGVGTADDAGARLPIGSDDDEDESENEDDDEDEDGTKDRRGGGKRQGPSLLFPPIAVGDIGATRKSNNGITEDPTDGAAARGGLSPAPPAGQQSSANTSGSFNDSTQEEPEGSDLTRRRDRRKRQRRIQQQQLRQQSLSHGGSSSSVQDDIPQELRPHSAFSNSNNNSNTGSHGDEYDDHSVNLLAESPSPPSPRAAAALAAMRHSSPRRVRSGGRSRYRHDYADGETHDDGDDDDDRYCSSPELVYGDS